MQPKTQEPMKTTNHQHKEDGESQGGTQGSKSPIKHITSHK